VARQRSRHTRVSAPASRGTCFDVVAHYKPTMLIGVSGVDGCVRRAARARDGEARRAARDFFRRRIRARIARRSPPICTRGPRVRLPRRGGQPVPGRRVRRQALTEWARATNVFVFPGLGLGALAVRARTRVTHHMIQAASKDARFPKSRRKSSAEAGCCSRPSRVLRAVSVAVAMAVAPPGRARRRGRRQRGPRSSAAPSRRTAWGARLPLARARLRLYGDCLPFSRGLAMNRLLSAGGFAPGSGAMLAAAPARRRASRRLRCTSRRRRSTFAGHRRRVSVRESATCSCTSDARAPTARDVKWGGELTRPESVGAHWGGGPVKWPQGTS